MNRQGPPVGGGDTGAVHHHQRPLVSVATAVGSSSTSSGILAHGSNAGPALKRARIQGYITPPPPSESDRAYVDVALPPETVAGEEQQQQGATTLYQEPAHHHVAQGTTDRKPQQRYRNNPYDSTSGKAMVDGSVPEGLDQTNDSTQQDVSYPTEEVYDPSAMMGSGEQQRGQRPTAAASTAGATVKKPAYTPLSSSAMGFYNEVQQFQPPAYQEPYYQGQGSNQHSTHCRQQHHQTLLRLQRFVVDQMPQQSDPFSCFCDPNESHSAPSNQSRTWSDGTSSAAVSGSQPPGLSDASTERYPPQMMNYTMPFNPHGGPALGSPLSSVHVGHFYPGQPRATAGGMQPMTAPPHQADPRATGVQQQQHGKTVKMAPPRLDSCKSQQKIATKAKTHQKGLRVLSPARRQVRIAPASENTASSPLGPLPAPDGEGGEGSTARVTRRASITVTDGGRSASSSKPLSRSSSVGTKTNNSSRFNSANRSISVGSRHSTANSVSSNSKRRSPSVASRRSCNSRGSATSRKSAMSGKSGISACSKYSRASASSKRSAQSKTVMTLRKIRKQKAKEAKRQARMLGKLPKGTLHRSLFGKVSFVPYPTGPFIPPRSAMFPSAGAVMNGMLGDETAGVAPEGGGETYHQSACGPLCKGGFHHHCTKGAEQNTTTSAEGEKPWVRLFFGQLPYEVTQMQLDWLCFTFGFGRTVHDMERIFKFDAKKSCRVPTGCLHAYCHKAFVDDIITGINRRLLVDDTGVWYARGGIEEQEALRIYCEGMKNNKKQRIHCRPYDAVSVQLATSTRGSGGQPTQNYTPSRGKQDPPTPRLVPPPMHPTAGATAGAGFPWQMGHAFQPGFPTYGGVPSVVVGGVPAPTVAISPVGAAPTIIENRLPADAESPVAPKGSTSRRLATVVPPKLTTFPTQPTENSPLSEVGSPAGSNSRRSSGTGGKKSKEKGGPSGKKKKVTMFTLPDELTPKDTPLMGNNLLSPMLAPPGALELLGEDGQVAPEIALLE